MSGLSEQEEEKDGEEEKEEGPFEAGGVSVVGEGPSAVKILPTFDNC